MIKRTIEISRQPAHLAVRNRQLLLLPRTDANSDDAQALNAPARSAPPLASIPCEDIGLLLVDQPSVTYSHAALVSLLEQDAAVVLCGKNHLPCGLLLPIGEHSEVVWRLRNQLKVSKPVKKRLWQQIVQAKIRAQAANIPRGTPTRSKLLALARNVKSGDPDNVEAHAAKVYWAAWRNSLLVDSTAAGDGLQKFIRDPDGLFPNSLLNYGYAVMRAAVARALVAAGLLPALGIRHSSRSNAFCLADDLVEPLRGFVDAKVSEAVQMGVTDMTPEAKRIILKLLAMEVVVEGQSGPLMVGLHRYIASLVRCYENAAARLTFPEAIGKNGRESAEGN